MPTTDPQNEPFVEVDAHDHVIGTLPRRVAHAEKSRIHRSVGILVFDSQGKLFLQKRSRTKDTYPGYWTISASGHPRSGMTYRQAAINELWEELGITEAVPLKRLGKRLMHYPQETEYETFYQTVYDGPLSLHPEEIATGKWFTLNRRFYDDFLKKSKISPELQYIVKNFL